MSITGRKIWRDLWRNKFRTFLVVLSTAVGVFSLGLVLTSTGLIWSSGYLKFYAQSETRGTLQVGTQGQPAPNAIMPVNRNRLLSVDALRGLIMILMAIDHMRGTIMAHPFEFWNAPLPHYRGAAEFLTRFVTHLCAPGFFFLMGMGMILFAGSRRQAGWTEWKIARHFALRGLVLILVEQFVVTPIQRGQLAPTELGVLYGLGAVMMVCALLVRLGRLPLLGVGVGIVLFTQVLPSGIQELGITATPLVRLLLVPGYAGKWFVLYPVLPWLGVAALGMAFGHEIARDHDKAHHLALFAGIVFLLLFLIARLTGGFGNFQGPAGPGWIDFLNLVKYPPSLVFTLFTLGVDLVLLSLFAKVGKGLERWGKPLLVLGETALFFYVTHWYIYTAIRVFFTGRADLPSVYLGWGVGLLLLYPLCIAYRAFKRQTGPDSMWRLF